MTLVEMLLEYQRQHGRDQPFSWTRLTRKFEAATGKECKSFTLKNRNRDMRIHWNEWKMLRHGETGLGWDPDKGTIDASDEWWDKKIKENAKFEKFRKKGVPPELDDLWGQLYGGTVATGEYCVAPSMVASQPASQTPPPASCTDDECVHGDGDGDVGASGAVPTGSAYSPLGAEFDELFGTQVGSTRPTSFQNIVRGISEGAPVEPSAPRAAHTRRVELGSESAPTPGPRSLRKSLGSSLYEHHVEVVQETSNRLLAMLERDEVSSSKPKAQTDDVFDIVEQMVAEGILPEGSPLWCYIVDQMTNPERRDMFLSMKRNEQRLAWMRFSFERMSG